MTASGSGSKSAAALGSVPAFFLGFSCSCLHLGIRERAPRNRGCRPREAGPDPAALVKQKPSLESGKPAAAPEEEAPFRRTLHLRGCRIWKE